MLGTLPDAGVRSAKVRDVVDRLPQTLRSDALDNRERILDAARAVFAAEGLDVPMREIARRAGVGPATLYRRFPTKQALVTEAFAEQMYACRAIVEEGLADPDPWQGLCLVIEKLCELHARNRGFTTAFTSAFPHAIDLAAEREHALHLARRARAPRQGHRPPAARLRLGRPHPHTDGQRRPARHINRRQGYCLPPFRGARHSSVSRLIGTHRDAQRSPKPSRRAEWSLRQFQARGAMFLAEADRSGRKGWRRASG